MYKRAERIVWNPPAYGVVCVGDVLVQLWETESPTPAFRTILSWCQARKERTDAPLWMITVVGENSTMPDAEARRVAAQFPMHFKEFVMVAEGTGFRASVVRSVLAGMAMLSPRRASTHVTSTLSEGVQLLGTLSEGAIHATTLHGTLGETRAELRR